MLRFSSLSFQCFGLSLAVKFSLNWSFVFSCSVRNLTLDCVSCYSGPRTGDGSLISSFLLSFLRVPIRYSDDICAVAFFLSLVMGSYSFLMPNRVQDTAEGSKKVCEASKSLALWENTMHPVELAINEEILGWNGIAILFPSAYRHCTK